jgi:hypothetical protein
MPQEQEWKMELSEARTIVTTLADGVDPIAGEVFAADSPYNHPLIIRALHAVLRQASTPRVKKSLDERRRHNLEVGRPRNAGLPWTDEGRTRVASGFQNGRTLEELAAEVERSRAAIHAELIRQGLVEPVAVQNAPATNEHVKTQK